MEVIKNTSTEGTQTGAEGTQERTFTQDARGSRKRQHNCQTGNENGMFHILNSSFQQDYNISTRRKKFPIPSAR